MDVPPPNQARPIYSQVVGTTSHASRVVNTATRAGSLPSRTQPPMMEDIVNVDASDKVDGGVLVYDATQQKYILQEHPQVHIEWDNVNW